MKSALFAAAFALAAPMAIADAPAVGPEPGAALLAIKTLPVSLAVKLAVASPTFPAGGEMPMQSTSYAGSVFPGLAWTKGPPTTKTYALIMQDDDAIYRGAPILHWSLYDVPANVLALPTGMMAPPAGASQGPNISGPAKPYLGPHTPPGPWHHYHFQVFALDAAIAPAPIKTYADLTAAMSGHVLASGDLVALAHAPPASLDAPSGAPIGAR